MPALIAAAKQQKMSGVQKVLQHLLMHTTTVAMTEGNKMTIRHMGQAMSLRFGPFYYFFTTNFADTLQPLDGGAAPGRRGAFRFKMIGYPTGFTSDANITGHA